MGPRASRATTWPRPRTSPTAPPRCPPRSPPRSPRKWTSSPGTEGSACRGTGEEEEPQVLQEGQVPPAQDERGQEAKVQGQIHQEGRGHSSGASRCRSCEEG